MKFNELVKLVMEEEESELDRQERIMHEKFPWVEKMEEKNSQILSSIIYYPEKDNLVYSVAFLPDYVKKKDAIEFAQTVFPRLKMGMDYFSRGDEWEKKDSIEIEHKDKKFKIDTDRIKYILGDELKSYDVSLENVETGYWDLAMSVENATQESPNKLINAFDLFYKAVKYLDDESEDYISGLEIEERY